ncbi:MAG: gliding motility protein GldL [Bacteroidetes bacterium]|nr:gliding motility protein GldL [Bacteroidota bacterium]
MAKLYGIGAAIVIVGALFKIQHWPFANEMLIVGLGTEAIIFLFSAFEPPHEEIDWSLVYPELAGMHEPGAQRKKVAQKAGDPVAQQLDKMLSDAKIGPELIQSLGSGLKSLGDNAGKMADISNATVATNEYSNHIKSASKSVADMTNAYGKATETMNSFNSSSADLKTYNEQMGKASKNLGALNAVYELQLQDSNKHLKETSKFYEGINTLMSTLNASVTDTQKYKEEVAKLSTNLTKLNTVYGNMLSAMSVK